MAPSNDAFDNIPYTALNEVWDPDNKEKTVPLLQYHILQGTVATGALEEGPSVVRSTLLTDPRYTNVTSGQNVVVNKGGDGTVILTTSMGTRCTLTDTDIPFKGGLIQVVDNLLIPPARLGETGHAFQLPSFLGGLYAADLMPNVAERKNITVFAPRDEAFEAVGGSLLDLDAKTLARVMGYHIIPNEVLVSSDLSNGTRLNTIAKAVNGDDTLSLLVRQAGNNKYVNSAQIVQPDILIANGILHLVSSVLNPDAAAAEPDPDAPSPPPLFPASSVEAPFTSDLPCTVSCPVTSTPSSSAAEATTTSSLFTSTSEDVAPRCTGRVAGAALGVMGIGAGMALL